MSGLARKPLIRATRVIRAGGWSDAAADTVTLAFEERHRRRFAMRGARGLDFLLDLPEATVLQDGDGLVLDDGRMIEVRARPEPLLEVRGRDVRHLMRLAWHLGNRHVPAALYGDHIRIRHDPVLAGMLSGLGADISAAEAPFEPEGGAYSGDGGHAHR